jgi:mannonate dehydratase
VRVGLTLSGDLLSEDGARFARQLGVEDVVVHLTDYGRGADARAYLAGEAVGPVGGDCSDTPLWSHETMADMVAMLARHGLRVAAMENLAPNFWSDILLDGPRKREQVEGLKRLVRDAGRAGIPVIGYNFSIAGVWGWHRRRMGRGGAVTAVFDAGSFDAEAPIPDGMVWNMRYREPEPGAAAVRVDETALWERLAWFLGELVPVAEEAGVRGIALRGLFLIDQEGNVRHQVVNDLPLGRSVDEALRMVQALQYFEKNGEVCPANWHEGARTIKPSPAASKEFFNAEYAG